MQVVLMKVSTLKLRTLKFSPPIQTDISYIASKSDQNNKVNVPVFEILAIEVFAGNCSLLIFHSLIKFKFLKKIIEFLKKLIIVYVNYL